MSLGICLISLFLFLLLTVFLQKQRRPTPDQESHPKTAVWWVLLSQLSFFNLKYTAQTARKQIRLRVHLSPFQASSHDQLSLGLVPIDPCDIHLEFDQSSINSPSSLDSNKHLTLTAENMSSRDPVHCYPGAGAAYWDSGGRESAISIQPASHLSDETWNKWMPKLGSCACWGV